MNEETVAKRLAELGNITRLRIFRYLVKRGPKGCAVGDVQKELAIPASTLSHHINRLMTVDLIKQNRTGRVLLCCPEFGAVNEVISFLMDECCSECN